MTIVIPSNLHFSPGSFLSLKELITHMAVVQIDVTIIHG